MAALRSAMSGVTPADMVLRRSEEVTVEYDICDE